MPPHIIHRKWTKKLGLRLPYLDNYPHAVWDEPFKWDVDRMIDFPKDHIDQFESSESLKRILIYPYLCTPRNLQPFFSVLARIFRLFHRLTG
jgi:hypothetical protein